MPKPVKPVTHNEHLSEQQLLDKFKKNSDEWKNMSRVVPRTLTRFRSLKGLSHLSNDQLTENYHYFKCPVTGLPFLEVSNNHFRRLGISGKRFLELFPQFKGIVETPYSTEFRRNKSGAKKAATATPDEMIKVGGVDVNLDELKRKINGKTAVSQLKKYGVDMANAIAGYHYYECPITASPLSGFNKIYFDKLKIAGITRAVFNKEFPSVDTRETTPFSRSIS